MTKETVMFGAPVKPKKEKGMKYDSFHIKSNGHYKCPKWLKIFAKLAGSKHGLNEALLNRSMKHAMVSGEQGILNWNSNVKDPAMKMNPKQVYRM